MTQAISCHGLPAYRQGRWLLGDTRRGSWGEEERSGGAGTMKDRGDRDGEVLSTGGGDKAAGGGRIENEGVTEGKDVLGLVVRC